MDLAPGVGLGLDIAVPLANRCYASVCLCVCVSFWAVCACAVKLHPTLQPSFCLLPAPCWSTSPAALSAARLSRDGRLVLPSSLYCQRQDPDPEAVLGYLQRLLTTDPSSFLQRWVHRGGGGGPAELDARRRTGGGRA